MKDTKQVIVIRKDLKMRRGKEISQGGHSVFAFVGKQLQKQAENDVSVAMVSLTPAQRHWLLNGTRKITVQVNSEKELLEVYQAAIEAGLPANLIIDSGKTEFAGAQTKTCVAIGPDWEDLIDKITGKLPLY